MMIGRRIGEGTDGADRAIPRRRVKEKRAELG